MTLELGLAPQDISVKLTLGADFIAGLDSEDGDWPAGATIVLAFNDTANTVWPATIVAAAVDWNIDQALVAALVSRLPTEATERRVALRYTDAATDLTWMTGTAVVYEGF